MQIGEALEAAHAKGIVHRDLKPSNVILQRTARCDSPPDDTVALVQPSDSISVKVLDFGLARTSAALAESPTVTADGTGHAVIMGTTPYMSPEQARGHAVDTRTDIWSAGIVLYEMVAARVPFTAQEAHAVLYLIVHSPHEPLTALRTDVPMELDRIVGKVLSKSPGERYQHVDELSCRFAQTPEGAGGPGPNGNTPASAAGSRLYIASGPSVSLPFCHCSSSQPRQRCGCGTSRTRREPSRNLCGVSRCSLATCALSCRPTGATSPFGGMAACGFGTWRARRHVKSPAGKARGDYYSDSGYYRPGPRTARISFFRRRTS